MTKLVCPEEQIDNPNMDLAASWTVAVTAGAADAQTTTAGKLTIAAFQGTVTNTMYRDIVAGGLYSAEVYVDSVTLGGGTLTVTCGGVTVASITAAGVYTKEFYTTTTAALVVTAATANVTAVIDKITVVKHGMHKGL